MPYKEEAVGFGEICRRKQGATAYRVWLEGEAHVEWREASRLVRGSRDLVARGEMVGISGEGLCHQ